MQTRLQGCSSGARRGAKFGAIAGITIWTVILIVMLAITFVIPELRQRGFADLEKEWNRYGLLWASLRMIGSFIATFGLMAMYGIAGGVFVMGIAGFLRPSETLSSAPVSDRANVVD
jgi:glycopeptide antibiotics resistance protein